MIPAAVVDASVAVKWLVPETDSAAARSLASTALLAPDLLPVEAANILWKKVRLGHLTPSEARRCLGVLAASPVVLVPAADLLEPALALALDLRHPVYDCVYLALAAARDLPLVTADQRLVATCRRHRKTAGRILPLAGL